MMVIWVQECQRRGGGAHRKPRTPVYLYFVKRPRDLHFLCFIGIDVTIFSLHITYYINKIRGVASLPAVVMQSNIFFLTI